MLEHVQAQDGVERGLEVVKHVLDAADVDPIQRSLGVRRRVVDNLDSNDLRRAGRCQPGRQAAGAAPDTEEAPDRAPSRPTTSGRVFE